MNNERYWDGDKCVDAIDYGQICTNESASSECQYITQETICMGTPYKCQCPLGKYFNKEKGHYKCETLLEINQTCLQGDSCKNANCLGLILKCQCLPFQYYDQISGQCLNQGNMTVTLPSVKTAVGGLIVNTTSNFIQNLFLSSFITSVFKESTSNSSLSLPTLTISSILTFESTSKLINS